MMNKKLTNCKQKFLFLHLEKKANSCRVWIIIIHISMSKWSDNTQLQIYIHSLFRDIFFRLVNCFFTYGDHRIKPMMIMIFNIWENLKNIWLIVLNIKFMLNHHFHMLDDATNMGIEKNWFQTKISFIKWHTHTH